MYKKIPFGMVPESETTPKMTNLLSVQINNGNVKAKLAFHQTISESGQYSYSATFSKLSMQ
jgi:hypothetical protein